MTDALTYFIGIAMFCGICWLLLQAGLLERGEVDRSEDGAQSERDVARIKEASQPMPLEPEHRRVRAGTAWGESS